MATKPREVFAVNERVGNSTTGEVKTFWTRVGVAFQNSDGSETLKLDALPLNGTLIVKDALPERAGAASGNGGRRG